MGYTHYYKVQKTYDEDLFAKIARDFQKVVDGNPEEKCLAGYDGTGKAEITDKIICFNGIGDESHESFRLEQSMSNEEVEDQKKIFSLRSKDIKPDTKFFTFTKTAEKPYDIYVQTALIIAKHYLKTKIDVESDGDNDRWDDASALCTKVLGYGKTFKLD